MSILINMEMPKDGRVTIQIGADGSVYSVIDCKIKAEKYESNLKAIEVPEQKHGKWLAQLYYDQFWANYCSECHSYLPQGMDWKPNYCPMCGAKMD